MAGVGFEAELCVLRSSLVNTREQQRKVIGWRATAPGGDAVKDALFHLPGRQEGCLSHNFSKTINAEHLTSGIEDFGNPVGV